MKSMTFALALGIFLWAPLAALAGEPPSQESETEVSARTSPAEEEGEPSAEASVSAPAIEFVPPVVDAPKTRLRSASSRGAGERWPALYTLSPEPVGRTVHSQPSLFWYVDGAPPAGYELVFTLTRKDRDAPVAERTLRTPERAGIQRIRLESMGVQLEPGVPYQWSLVLDPQRRSRDLLARSGIELVATPAKLGSGSGPGAYAHAGLWYDAFALVEEALETTPNDPSLASMRASLLRQVGLDEVVESL
jgi:hypothetical protein